MIRNLTQKDIKEVLEFEKDADFSIGRYLENEDYVWGYYLNNKLIGACTIGGAEGWNEIKESKYYSDTSLLLSEVNIIPGCRGKRHGQQMVAEALQAYMNKGHRKENVFIDMLEPSLKHFYQKLGFIEAFADDKYIMVLPYKKAVA